MGRSATATPSRLLCQPTPPEFLTWHSSQASPRAAAFNLPASTRLLTLILVLSLWNPLGGASALSCADKNEDLWLAARQVSAHQLSLRDLPAPFHEYARFHADSLREASTNRTARVRYLVYFCETGHLCGGLGDRFKGIVTSLYLAMVTRRVLLLHQWPIPLADALQPKGVDWLTWAECVQTRSTRTLVSMSGPIKDFQNITLDAAGLVKGSLSPVEVVSIRANSPMWQAVLACEKARQFMRRNLRELVEQRPGRGHLKGLLFTWAWHFLFRHTKWLDQSIEQLSGRLGVPPPGSWPPWLGVQIRIGGGGTDYATDKPRFNLTQVDTYAVCAVAAKDRLRAGSGTRDLPSVPMYVTSDRQEAVQLFIAAMVARGWNASMIRYSDQPTFHVERSVLGNVYTLDEARQLTVDTLAQLFLLSRMACIVHGQSGFSVVAVDLSRNVQSGSRCERLIESCHPTTR